MVQVDQATSVFDGGGYDVKGGQRDNEGIAKSTRRFFRSDDAGGYEERHADNHGHSRIPEVLDEQPERDPKHYERPPRSPAEDVRPQEDSTQHQEQRKAAHEEDEPAVLSGRCPDSLLQWWLRLFRPLDYQRRLSSSRFLVRGRHRHQLSSLVVSAVRRRRRCSTSVVVSHFDHFFILSGSHFPVYLQTLQLFVVWFASCVATSRRWYKKGFFLKKRKKRKETRRDEKEKEAISNIS